MCWSRGISSQSKQHIVSPVRNRVPLRPRCSSILRKCAIRDDDFGSLSLSFAFNNNSFNFWKRDHVQLATSSYERKYTRFLVKAATVLIRTLNKFSTRVATSLSCTKRLCPPGMFFMMCRSIFSFSNIASPLSIKIGGGVAWKLVRKSGGGFCMSTVVTFNEIVFSSARRYKSMKYSWQKRQAPFRRPSIVDAWKHLIRLFHAR